MGVYTAPCSLLIRASSRRHRFELGHVELGRQVDQLGWCHEQQMIVPDEVTTGAAGVALPGGLGVFLDLGLDPFVQGRYFCEESAVSLWFSHHRLFLLIRSILSAA